jgi:hypothetical protein
LQASFDLQDRLVAIERGFTSGLAPTTDVARVISRKDRAPGAIPRKGLKGMLALEYTDKEIGDWFGCSAKTVYRRRRRLGLLRRALMHSTTDAMLARVSHDASYVHQVKAQVA